MASTVEVRGTSHGVFGNNGAVRTGLYSDPQAAPGESITWSNNSLLSDFKDVWGLDPTTAAMHQKNLAALPAAKQQEYVNNVFGYGAHGVPAANAARAQLLFSRVVELGGQQSAPTQPAGLLASGQNTTSPAATTTTQPTAATNSFTAGTQAEEDARNRETGRLSAAAGTQAEEEARRLEAARLSAGSSTPTAAGAGTQPVAAATTQPAATAGAPPAGTTATAAPQAADPRNVPAANSLVPGSGRGTVTETSASLQKPGMNIDNLAQLGDVAAPAAGGTTPPATTNTGTPATTTPTAAPAMTTPAGVYGDMPNTSPYSSIPQIQAVRADPNQTVEARLNGLLATNSDYMNLARSGAMRTANSRGLLNSTMAATGGEAAAIGAALPIAQQDSEQYHARILTAQQGEIQSRIAYQEAVSDSMQSAQEYQQLAKGAWQQGDIDAAHTAQKAANDLIAQAKEYEQKSLLIAKEYEQRSLLSGQEARQEADLTYKKFGYDSSLATQRSTSDLTLQIDKYKQESALLFSKGEIDAALQAQAEAARINELLTGEKAKTEGELTVLAEKQKQELLVQANDHIFQQGISIQESQQRLTEQLAKFQFDSSLLGEQGNIDMALANQGAAAEIERLGLTHGFNMEVVKADAAVELERLKTEHGYTVEEIETQGDVEKSLLTQKGELDMAVQGLLGSQSIEQIRARGVQDRHTAMQQGQETRANIEAQTKADIDKIKTDTEAQGYLALQQHGFDMEALNAKMDLDWAKLDIDERVAYTDAMENIYTNFPIKMNDILTDTDLDENQRTLAVKELKDSTRALFDMLGSVYDYDLEWGDYDWDDDLSDADGVKPQDDDDAMNTDLDNIR